MPDKRDYTIVEDDDGQRITLQKCILLCSTRETYQLHLMDKQYVCVSLSLTSFRELQQMIVLVQSYMSHRHCLRSYHQNVNLLLKSLSKHINRLDLNSFQTFSSALVCDEANKDYMFH